MKHNKTKNSDSCILPLCLIALLACNFLVLLLPVADGRAETRALKIYYVHTNERAQVVFKKNGRYVNSGLKQLNYLLRDWRRNEPTRMDPRLFDLVWQVYQMSGSHDYIHVISGYRSAQTNNMLRIRTAHSGVAKNSQHMLGKAMDFYLPDVNLERLWEIGLRQQAGGVGYYPSSGSPFVHMDVGNVRHWPRMSRRELMALFPDGKTMHIPNDGHPLEHYAQAVAEYRARAGRPALVMMAETKQATPRSVFSSLAGSRQDAMTVSSTQRHNAASLSDRIAAGLPENVPVPDAKPEKFTIADKPFAAAGAYPAAQRALLQVPVPDLRIRTEQDRHQGMHKEDQIAVAIRQNSMMMAGAQESFLLAREDEIGALIAQDNFVPLPDEGGKEHEDAAWPGGERQAGRRAGSQSLPLHPAVKDVAITTAKTSKSLIGRQTDMMARAGSSRANPVSFTDELKEVPDRVFTFGLQQISYKPEIARLSGAAVNFRSVARLRAGD